MSHEDITSTPPLPGQDPAGPGAREEAPPNTAPVPQVMEEELTGVVVEPDNPPAAEPEIPMEVVAGDQAPVAGSPDDDPASDDDDPASDDDEPASADDEPASDDDELEEPTATGTVHDALSRRIVELEHTLAEEKSHRLRALADLDNWRKRSARDHAIAVGKAHSDVVIEFLPVLDNLELALEHAKDGVGIEGLREGVSMVLKQFRASLAKFGIQEIDAAGRPFDPTFHEAMAQSPSEEYPAGIVIKQWQKGFLLGDRLIRPCRVVVSSGPGPASENTPVDPTED